ncbi:phenylacetate--CoA ligase family protein [Luteimonas terricola]|uniref:Adenylyltransferase n=1 Tax=Luteimonas terricola TaxID=645597 RepID=A0ABQ2EIW3_9GAMM|nr:phenylacetate--CoA ligase family protein [Luteimonas terricola]GGK09077.1 adenylyltransferase [Luteimonas terricola]
MNLYEHAFRRAMFPSYEALRGRKTLRYLGEYEANQWRSPEQLAEIQWSRLKALVAHCWQDVPFYRARWQAVGFEPGDLRSMQDYARLPVLTKADIRAHHEDLKARSLRGGLLYKATGGSTGEPLRFGFTRESNDRRTAVMWRGYGWTGARMGRRTLFLWGGAVGEPTRTAQLKDRLFHAAFHRRMLNCFLMRDDNMAAYADAIAAYRPEVIVAYVDPIFRLSKWLLAQGRSIPGVVSVLGAAEALHDFQRPVIEAAFPGAKAYNTYGCREFMLIACEAEDRDGLLVSADHLVVELVNASRARDGNETGELAITDLHNLGMPFIRYVNGDIASRKGPWHTTGRRGLPHLSRIDGRRLDAIRTPDGRVLPGEFFPHMLKDVAGVRRFQVVQDSLERFTLKVVPGDGFGAEQEAYVRREISKVLGSDASLDLQRVDDIPLTASGKFRVTVSRLP